VRRIEQLRLDEGLSRQALAELAGVSEDTIRAMELADTTPRVATLVAVARPLKCKPSELLMDALPPGERAA
jgi:transcriptional regulator with XRE-family HTH domain